MKDRRELRENLAVPLGIKDDITDLKTQVPVDTIDSLNIELAILMGGVSSKIISKLSIQVLRIFLSLIRKNPTLNAKQKQNFARFLQKAPANSKDGIEIIKLKNGHVKFRATSQGIAPNSKAVYEKIVNYEGKTISYKKTTIYDSKIIHIKDKFGKNIP